MPSKFRSFLPCFGGPKQSRIDAGIPTLATQEWGRRVDVYGVHFDTDLFVESEPFPLDWLSLHCSRKWANKIRMYWLRSDSVWSLLSSGIPTGKD